MYTEGALPSQPICSTQYHYDNAQWSDMLTGMSYLTYDSNGTAVASINNAKSSDDLAKRILGNDFKTVELSDNLLKRTSTDTASISSSTIEYDTIESDAIGNIVKINEVDINWNGRRLKSVSENGKDIVTYKYNADGQRISKTVDGVTTEYFYNGSILAGQKTGKDVIIFMYDNNGDIFGFTYNGEEYYYVKNAQNDVYLIINFNGQGIILYRYNIGGIIGAEAKTIQYVMHRRDTRNISGLK